MLSITRQKLQRNRFYWVNTLVMLIVAAWILGLCIMTGPLSDPTMASHHQQSSAPAKLMVMEPMMAMDEHECCEPTVASACDTGAEISLQQWSELLSVGLYIVIALLVFWSLLSPFRAVVQRFIVTKPPPIYLLTCVFRH